MKKYMHKEAPTRYIMGTEYEYGMTSEFINGCGIVFQGKNSFDIAVTLINCLGDRIAELDAAEEDELTLMRIEPLMKLKFRKKEGKVVFVSAFSLR